MVQLTHKRMQQGGTHASHITDFRWYNPQTGQQDRSTTAAMVEFLRKPGSRAYVCDGRNIVDVHVVQANPPYLRTVRDGVETDDLRELPDL